MASSMDIEIRASGGADTTHNSAMNPTDLRVMVFANRSKHRATCPAGYRARSADNDNLSQARVLAPLHRRRAHLFAREIMVVGERQIHCEDH